MVLISQQFPSDCTWVRRNFAAIAKRSQNDCAATSLNFAGIAKRFRIDRAAIFKGTQSDSAAVKQASHKTKTKLILH
jgi:hypothetical protein